MEMTALFIYDGNCSFCRCWVRRWEKKFSFRGKFVPYEESVHLPLTGVNRERFENGALFWGPRQGSLQGGAAVVALFEESGKHRWLVTLYRSFRGVRKIVDEGYRFVARHRSFFSKISFC